MEKLILAALLAAFSINAQAQLIPTVAKNAPYTQVRAALIKEGWRPVRQSPEDFGLAKKHRDKGWIEVASCASSGVAPCLFIWQNKNGKILEVLTQYEDPQFIGFR